MSQCMGWRAACLRTDFQLKHSWLSFRTDSKVWLLCLGSGRAFAPLTLKPSSFSVSSLFLCFLSSTPEMAPVHLLIPPRNDKVPESFKKKRLCNDIQATWNRYFISKAVGSFSHAGTVPSLSGYEGSGKVAKHSRWLLDWLGNRGIQT